MSNQNQIKVLSVESNVESRRVLHAFFARTKDIVLSAEAADQSQALKELQDKAIDLALVDLGPETDGVELTKQIRASQPAVRVLIVTASDTPEDIFAAMDAGADGYVLKGNVANVLEVAIRSVRLGTVWLDPAIAKQVLEAIQNAPPSGRILATGMLVIPLLPDENSILSQVAGSSCKDGVCMVDPSFVRKLRRFASAISAD